MSDFDDTAMTEEEFDHRFAEGAPVEVVPGSALWTDGSVPSLSQGGRTQVITLPASSTMTAKSVSSGDPAREAVLTR
jgi:hypothetical protein